MSYRSLLKDMTRTPVEPKIVPKTVGLASVNNLANANILTRLEVLDLRAEMNQAYIGLEDASQVLEEMKKVIVQHEANVQAEEAKDGQEGVGETDDGKLVADTQPESEGGEGGSEGGDSMGDDLGGGFGGDEGGDTGDSGEDTGGDEGGDSSDEDFSLGDGDEDTGEGNSEEGEASEASEGEGESEGEGTAEASEEDVDKASEEKQSKEDSAKEMNMAGEMLSGALFGARYKDLKAVLGINSIGLNSVLTNPNYVQQESLSDLKEVKNGISSYFSTKVKEYLESTKVCLTKGKEELEEIVKKASALVKSIEAKEVKEGNFSTENELKPYYKILLQDGITKDNLKIYFEKTLEIMKTLTLDSERLQKLFQLAKGLDGKDKSSNQLREAIFWEFVKPLAEVSKNKTVDVISQYTNSKTDGGQGSDVHVSNQDPAMNGLRLIIRPVKYDAKKGVYNSLKDPRCFGRSTVLYPNIELNTEVPLTKVKQLAIDICTAIQESADNIRGCLDTAISSVEAAEGFSPEGDINNDLMEDILDAISIITYDHAAFALASLSKLRKSLDGAAVYTSSLA